MKVSKICPRPSRARWKKWSTNFWTRRSLIITRRLRLASSIWMRKAITKRELQVNRLFILILKSKLVWRSNLARRPRTTRWFRMPTKSFGPGTANIILILSLGTTRCKAISRNVCRNWNSGKRVNTTSAFSFWTLRLPIFRSKRRKRKQTKTISKKCHFAISSLATCPAPNQRSASAKFAARRIAFHFFWKLWTACTSCAAQAKKSETCGSLDSATSLSALHRFRGFSRKTTRRSKTKWKRKRRGFKRRPLIKQRKLKNKSLNLKKENKPRKKLNSTKTIMKLKLKKSIWNIKVEIRVLSIK